MKGFKTIVNSNNKTVKQNVKEEFLSMGDLVLNNNLYPEYKSSGYSLKEICKVYGYLYVFNQTKLPPMDLKTLSHFSLKYILDLVNGDCKFESIVDYMNLLKIDKNAQ